MRIVRDDKIETLAGLELFRDLTTEQLAELSGAAETISLPRFRDLTHQDTKGDLVYVIISGMVQVKRDGRVLAYLQDGDVVGELSVLDATPRTATVTTVTDTELVVIDRRHLGPVLDDNPVVAERLDRVAGPRRAA